MFTNSRIIFFNKDSIKRKRNVSFQKRECIYELTLDVSFVLNSFFVQSHGCILLVMLVYFVARN